MLVWGGSKEDGGECLRTGGRYNPQTDTWAPISNENAPSARCGHTAVWSGRVMVVWGGVKSNHSVLESGGRYEPATDRWLPMSTLNAPAGRVLHTAVWMGSLMVVWGGSPGFSQEPLDTGGRYDPSSDTWTSTSTSRAPAPRTEHTAVWTGSLMVVWGGLGPFDGTPPGLDTGGRYDPVTDTWSATTTASAPAARAGHTAIWTGGFMLVWGGSSLDTGGRYFPGQSLDDGAAGGDTPGGSSWSR